MTTPTPRPGPTAVNPFPDPLDAASPAPRDPSREGPRPARFAPDPPSSDGEAQRPNPERPTYPGRLGHDFEAGPFLDSGADSLHPPDRPATLRGRFGVRCTLEYWGWCSMLAGFLGFKSLAGLVEYSLRRAAELHRFPTPPPERVPLPTPRPKVSGSSPNHPGGLP